MNTLFLDIESLPTDDDAVKAEIAASITPPSTMSKADTIAEWEAKKKPGLVAEAIAKTSFDGGKGRVCCIGWAWNDEPAQSIQLSDSRDERTFLDAAAELVEITRPKYVAFHQTKIVGHYVADFDIRFLWQRAFALGVRMPAWFPRDVKSWDKNVSDTMFMWAGAKGSISLDNLCKALGIKGKTGVDGSMVAGMWERGEYEAVGDYCIGDVERVRNVYRKMQIAYGEAE